MLTGRPPFQGENEFETLLQVLEREPVAPGRLRGDLDRDMEIICLKCLRKDPQERYPSAEALADDLDSWLAGRPILARPAGRVERIWSWCRRHPVPTLAAAVVLLTVAVAFALVMGSRNEAWQLAREEKRQRRQAEYRLTRMANDRASQLFQEGDVQHGLLWSARCQELAGDGAEDLRAAALANLAVWRRQCRGLIAMLPHDDEVLAVGFSADGKLLVTGGSDQTARLWDATTGEPVGSTFIHKDPHARLEPGERDGQVVAVALSPDGQVLATGTSAPSYRGRWRVWETGLLAGLRAGRQPSPAPPGNSDRQLPFGSALCASVWKVNTKERLNRASFSDTVWTVAFSPDGRLLLTGEGDLPWLDEIPHPRNLVDPAELAFGPINRWRKGWATLWDWQTGREVGHPMDHANAVLAAAFDPKGQRVLTGSADGTAQVWKLPGCEPVGKPLVHEGPVVAVAFSPDGRLLLTVSYTGKQGAVQLWDASTGSRSARLQHALPVLAAAFSPDGQTIVAGCGNPVEGPGEACFWDVATSQLRGHSIPHPGAVQAVAYSPDGQKVLTASTDRVARLWEATTLPPILARKQYDRATAFSPDGRSVLRGGGDRPLQICDASTGEATGPLFANKKEARGTTTAYFSPNGRYVLTLSESTGLLWDVVTGAPVGSPLKLQEAIRAVAISPDGQRVLAGHNQSFGRSSTGQFWDVAAGKPIAKPLAHQGPIRAAAFSPDGRKAAVASDDGTARLCDPLRGEALGAPLAHKGPVRAVAFSPDGSLLATGSDDHTARLWDTASGQPASPPLPAGGAIRVLAFSPDGSLLATGSDERIAQVWDVKSGTPVGTPLEHEGRVRSVAFSPDGRFVLTGSMDGLARLWQASSGCPVGSPLRRGDPVLAVGFGPDGRTLLTRTVHRENTTIVRERLDQRWEHVADMGWNGTGHVWPLPDTLEVEHDTVTRWVEALTGMTLDANGGIQRITLDGWTERRPSLQQVEGKLGAKDALSWHRQEASAAESREQHFAASWHLQRLIQLEPEEGSHYLRRSRALALQGDPEAALQDAAKSIELLPGDPGARVFRAQVYGARGRWQEAVQDLTEALDRQKENPAILQERGRAYVEMGRWKEAADDFRSAAVGSDGAIEPWADLALASLAGNDLAGYRLACNKLLPRNRVSMSKLPGMVIDELPLPLRVIDELTLPLTASDKAHIAWVCSLGASERTYFQLAEEAVKADEKAYLHARAFGAALYRAGAFDKAVKELSRAAGLRTQPTPAVWLVLAMAHQQLKQPDEARTWFDKADAWIEQSRQQKEPTPDNAFPWGRLPWQERLALELLHREARDLLKIDAPRKD